MNIAVMLIITFVLNGTPQTASFVSTSPTACLVDMDSATTAVRSAGGTVIDVFCVMRKS